MSFRRRYIVVKMLPPQRSYRGLKSAKIRYKYCNFNYVCTPASNQDCVRNREKVRYGDYSI